MLQQFRDVLNNLHQPMNMLLTDEVSGGSLDPLNVEAMIKLIKHKAYNDKIGIYCIEHHPAFENRLDKIEIKEKMVKFLNLLHNIKTNLIPFSFQK